MKKTFDKKRPLSWSAISSFEYDPEQWYKKYVLGEEQVPNKEMQFGKMIADSFGTDMPLAPVERYEVIEQKFEVMFNNIPLIGYADTYKPNTRLREYKTGKKAWDQKRADEHGQITMYALMIYITYKVRPEFMVFHLDWIPTQDNGDFTISFVQPIKVHTFETKRTMQDILVFGQRIIATYKAMEQYCQNHL